MKHATFNQKHDAAKGILKKGEGKKRGNDADVGGYPTVIISQEEKHRGKHILSNGRKGKQDKQTSTEKFL